jgi:hypothetical protein
MISCCLRVRLAAPDWIDLAGTIQRRSRLAALAGKVRQQCGRLLADQLLSDESIDQRFARVVGHLSEG